MSSIDRNHQIHLIDWPGSEVLIDTMSTFEYKAITGFAKLYQFSKHNDAEFESETYSD